MPATVEQLATLYREAQRAALHAYAPYSGFRVGAALLFDDRVMVTGCNVENASYGMTLCAERSALARAISQRGNVARLLAIAVANRSGAGSPPCGACRQMLSEFVTEDAVVVFPGEGGIAASPVPFRELFPHSFRLESREPGA